MSTKQVNFNLTGDGGKPAAARSVRSPSDLLKPKDVPKPPKRKRGIRANLVVLFNFMMTCLVLATLAICAAGLIGKYWFEKTGPLKTSQTIMIEEGNSVAQIARKLKAGGVIDNDMIFRLWVRAHNAQASLKAGEYLFTPQMSMFDVMNTIRSGKGVLYKVSLPEGLTVYQVFERLRNDETLVGELPEILPPEGSLMPDTYPFTRGVSRQQILDRMAKAQTEFVQEVWQRRTSDLPINSIEELVTLASIVEKETGLDSERPQVASVFVNRLRAGMKLQSDPTIIYGIFGGAGKPKDRPIYRSDIDTPTPYNTYTIPALPPGPIANPGRAALEAVANPSRTDYFFFVANGTGGHAFAKTLDEHNDNVQRWRAIEAQRQKDAQAASVSGEQ